MTQQTTVLIAGSRKLKATPENLRRLELALDEVHAILATENENWDYPSCIIHGGAHGADQLAGQLAKKLGLKEEIRKPDYGQWNWNWAPLKRNLEMIADAGAVIVIYAPHNIRKGRLWLRRRKNHQGRKTPAGTDARRHGEAHCAGTPFLS